MALPRSIITKSRHIFDKISRYYEEEYKSKFEKRKNFKVVITEKGNALNNDAKLFEVSIVSKEDIAQQLFNTRSDVFKLLENQLTRDKGIKAEVTLIVSFKKEDTEGDLIFAEPYFNSKIFEIKNKYEIQIALDIADEEIKKTAAKWVSEGSGWVIDKESSTPLC